MKFSVHFVILDEEVADSNVGAANLIYMHWHKDFGKIRLLLILLQP